VAVGMRAGLYLSHRRHPDAIPRERADDLIRAIPVDADPAALSFDALYDAMATDKKNEGDTIRFVLLRRLGEAYVTGDISRAETEQAWAFASSA